MFDFLPSFAWSACENRQREPNPLVTYHIFRSHSRINPCIITDFLSVIGTVTSTLFTCKSIRVEDSHRRGIPIMEVGLGFSAVIDWILPGVGGYSLALHGMGRKRSKFWALSL